MHRSASAARCGFRNSRMLPQGGRCKRNSSDRGARRDEDDGESAKLSFRRTLGILDFEFGPGIGIGWF